MTIVLTEHRLRSATIPHFPAALMNRTASIILEILANNTSHGYNWKDIRDDVSPSDASKTAYLENAISHLENAKEDVISYLENWRESKNPAPSKELASVLRSLSYVNDETPYRDESAIRSLLSDINEYADKNEN